MIVATVNTEQGTDNIARPSGAPSWVSRVNPPPFGTQKNNITLSI